MIDISALKFKNRVIEHTDKLLLSAILRLVSQSPFGASLFQTILRLFPRASWDFRSPSK
jgi:hypothetical protein